MHFKANNSKKTSIIVAAWLLTCRLAITAIREVQRNLSQQPTTEGGGKEKRFSLTSNDRLDCYGR
ncbi:hypothetical protein JL36_13535 [Lactococcus cremoris]|nr:hypothetical protein JL36_13500 [Lactococcus cremoris]KGH32435.1 hypothetical protein JL36_13535 [Lactococcus cremoris]